MSRDRTRRPARGRIGRGAVEERGALSAVEIEAANHRLEMVPHELVAGEDVDVQHAGRELRLGQCVRQGVAMLSGDRRVGVADLDDRLVPLVFGLEVGWGVWRRGLDIRRRAEVVGDRAEHAVAAVVAEIPVDVLGDAQGVAAGGLDDRLPAVDPLLRIAIADHTERGERARAGDRQPDGDVATFREMSECAHVVPVLAPARLPARWGELEPGELESWHDDATHQCEFASRLGRLPGMGWHEDLRPVGSEQMIGFVDRQPERRTEVMQPDLVSIDTVPMRTLAGAEQEVDRRGGRAPVATIRTAPRLDEVPTLRMRRHAKRPDDDGSIKAASGV